MTGPTLIRILRLAIFCIAEPLQVRYFFSTVWDYVLSRRYGTPEQAEVAMTLLRQEAGRVFIQLCLGAHTGIRLYLPETGDYSFWRVIAEVLLLGAQLTLLIVTYITQRTRDHYPRRKEVPPLKLV